MDYPPGSPTIVQELAKIGLKSIYAESLLIAQVRIMDDLSHARSTSRLQTFTQLNVRFSYKRNPFLIAFTAGKVSVSAPSAGHSPFLLTNSRTLTERNARSRMVRLGLRQQIELGGQGRPKSHRPKLHP